MSEPSPEPTDPPDSSGPLIVITPINTILVIICLLAAAWTSWGRDLERVHRFFISAWPASSPLALIEVRHGAVWRLFSPAFVHLGLTPSALLGAFHLGLNMLAMISLGGALEEVQGSRFYLGFVAAVALCSNLAQYAVSGLPYFGGMSGVIFGLFGFLWVRPALDREYVLELHWLGVVLTLALFAFGFTGLLPIANTVHAVGLGIGAAWGALSAVAARRQQQQAANGLPTPP